MRCTKIHFNGFKRLADTSCDVSPRLLAFVGQNEAGKSTVLNGLEWLTEDGETPLENLHRSRAKKKESGWIVGAVFRLEAEDLALLEPLGFETLPRDLGVWKQADGSKLVKLRNHDDLRRDPAPFVNAATALAKASGRMSKQFSTPVVGPDDEEDSAELPSDWAETVSGALEDPEHEWTEDEVLAAERLENWLTLPGPAGTRARDAGCSDLIREARLLGSATHPRDAAAEVLADRVPQFVQFHDADRYLPTLTTVGGRNRLNVEPAVANLFKIASVDPQAIWRAHVEGDTGEVASLLEAANDKLDAFFHQAWNQSNISIRFDTHAEGLLTHTFEIDSRRHTRMEERSDGLRAFVALAAFLGARESAIPPILLIDEAENHLHLNAQADLVGVLLRQVQATQVIYTTHSPGCLPSDLGTGIRLVERADPQTSKLRTHFWTTNEPGFGPLLFAMGASAAAFSACRYAVLAEGASDMILLPTLIRLATGLDDLEYQVAPGLANVRSFDAGLEEIAAKVMYLVDGDADGQRYAARLEESASVPAQRVLSLPAGSALEDLLTPECYLNAVASLASGVTLPPYADLPQGVPIAAALATWASEQSPEVPLPGKVAVAYAILDRDNLELAQSAADTLKELDDRLVAGFNLARPAR